MATVVTFTLPSISLASLEARAVLRLYDSTKIPGFSLRFMMAALSLTFIVGFGHVSPYGWRSAAVGVPMTISALSLFIVLFLFSKEFRYFAVSKDTFSAFRAILARAAPAIVVLYLRKSDTRKPWHAID
jgi:hypothetical protein